MSARAVSGSASAASRVGAAIGTWLLPVGLASLGVGPCMVIGAVICVAGALVSQFMAPETTGRTLTETAMAGPADGTARTVAA